MKNIFKTIFISGGVTSGEIITLVKVIGKRYVPLTNKSGAEAPLI